MERLVSAKRLSGPFTVEAVPAPTVESADDLPPLPREEGLGVRGLAVSDRKPSIQNSLNLPDN
jgi:hypothetical protein